MKLFRSAAITSFLSLILFAPSVPSQAVPRVSLGIDELERRGFDLLQGKRVGLVTHRAAANAEGELTIRVLQRATGFKLVCLFGPEHGVDTTAKAGDTVVSKVHPEFKLMAHSLYGATRRPTVGMLKDLDVLVYDVQDVGSRSYTYINTLAYVLEAAAARNLEVIVLDRPNPLGGQRIAGPRLDGISSFVGLYDIPFVYGLTPGELALWANANHLKQPAKLTVIPMRGWTRSMDWESTGLTWLPPSPKIPNPRAAFGYAAISFLGEIGITNGVMTDEPFEVLGRAQVDPVKFARDFNALGLDGITVEPYRIRSTHGRWKGSVDDGLKLNIDPRGTGNLHAVGYLTLELMMRQLPGWDPFARTTKDQRDLFDKCTGSPKVRAAIQRRASLRAMVASWAEGERSWREERKPYLLYPDQAPVLAPPPVLAQGPESPKDSITAPPSVVELKAAEGPEDVPTVIYGSP